MEPGQEMRAGKLRGETAWIFSSGRFMGWAKFHLAQEISVMYALGYTEKKR